MATRKAPKRKSPASKAKASVKRATSAVAAKARKTGARLVAAAKSGGKKTKRMLAAKAKKATPRAKDSAAVVAAKSGALSEGTRAPDFKALDQDGRVLSSDELRGKPFVLYFYPKDDTSGCTREACGFRDFLPRFLRHQVRVLGVSPDSPASHQKFRDKYGLPFTLLSDQDKKLAQSYGVWVKKQNYGREYMGIDRSTFVIDEKGMIRKIWRGVRVDGHVEKVLDALGQM
jgi:peroxiredoxin Q/BCP